MEQIGRTPLDVLRDQLPVYFAAEKHEALLFLLVGLAAIGLSIWLVTSHNSYRGMAYPLVVVALIQIAVGWTVHSRTDGQVVQLTAQLDADPLAFVSDETSRMATVIRNFHIYKAIEIALLLCGVLMTLMSRQTEVFYGAGVGLVAQAALMLVLDLFAEKRAYEYVDAVRGLGS